MVPSSARQTAIPALALPPVLPIALIALISLGACGHRRSAAKETRGSTERVVDVKGVARKHLLLVPDDAKTDAPSNGAAAPLVVLFHGGGGDPASMAGLVAASRFVSAGFVVSLPAGLEKSWNDGRPEVAASHEDVAFFDALLADVPKAARIDPARVFLAGISNGGMMTYRLACERARKVRAFAPVAALMGERLSGTCKPERPVSRISLFGIDDPLVPEEGGEVTLPVTKQKRGRVLSLGATIDFWRKAMDCEGEPDKETGLGKARPPDGTSTTRESAKACEAGAAVVDYRIEGGGHTWPGGSQYLPRAVIGPVARGLDATGLLIEAFRSMK